MVKRRAATFRRGGYVRPIRVYRCFRWAISMAKKNKKGFRFEFYGFRFMARPRDTYQKMKERYNRKHRAKYGW